MDEPNDDDEIRYNEMMKPITYRSDVDRYFIHMYLLFLLPLQLIKKPTFNFWKGCNCEMKSLKKNFQTKLSHVIFYFIFIIIFVFARVPS